MTPLQKILAERDEKMAKTAKSAWYPKDIDLPLETYIKQYARSIVEQSVPEEKDINEGETYTEKMENLWFNTCRAQTLSNADNLLK